MRTKNTTTASPRLPWVPGSWVVRAACLLGVAGAVQGQGTVFVGGPRADYASLELAVDGAPAGSLLLVEPGEYGHPFNGGFAIDGKSLTIAPSSVGGRIEYGGEIAVRNLGPGQSVTLIGIDGSAIDLGNALLVESITGGVVWVEDCSFLGNPSGIFSDPTPARFLSADDVVIVRSSFTAVTQILVGFPGNGLIATDSSLHLFDVSVVGAKGTLGTGESGGPGGLGFVLDSDGFLYTRGSTFQGGEGGDVSALFGGDCSGLSGGPGGAGLVLDDAGAHAVLVDTALLGGAGGTQERGGTCAPGAVGATSEVDPGAVLEEYPSVPHTLTLASPTSPIADVTLDFQAVEGEFAWYLLAGEPGATFVPGKFATEVVGEHIVLPVGTVGPGGVLQGSLPAVLGPGPGYAATFGGTVLYLQPFTFDTPASLALLGSPSALVVRPLGGAPFVKRRSQAQAR